MPPPAPTAASCRWSPVSRSFAPAESTRPWIAARSAVVSIAASSTITRSPAAKRQSASTVDQEPSASRAWVCSHRVTFRAGKPSPTRTSVATCEAARPTTRGGRGRESQVSAEPQILESPPITVDLPAPAGPTSVSILAPEVSTPTRACRWSALRTSPESASRSVAASAAFSSTAGAPISIAALRRACSVTSCPRRAYRRPTGSW